LSKLILLANARAHLCSDKQSKLLSPAISISYELTDRHCFGFEVFLRREPVIWDVMAPRVLLRIRSIFCSASGGLGPDGAESLASDSKYFLRREPVIWDVMAPRVLLRIRSIFCSASGGLGPDGAESLASDSKYFLRRERWPGT